MSGHLRASRLSPGFLCCPTKGCAGRFRPGYACPLCRGDESAPVVRFLDELMSTAPQK